MFARLFAPSRRARVCQALFAHVTAAARDPAYFGDGKTPDTPDGRFEVLTLFSFLLFRRLKGEGPEAEEVSQEVFNALFKSFDQALRDLGVGDLSVGKRIRKLAESFYGRIAVYDAALDSPDADALADALARNVLGQDSADAGGAFARELAESGRAWLEALRDMPLSDLLAGKV